MEGEGTLSNGVAKAKGLFRVLRWDARGSRHWAEELKKRRIPANFNADEKQLDKDSDWCARYAPWDLNWADPMMSALLDESYDAQYEKMTRVKNKLEAVTGSPCDPSAPNIAPITKTP